MAGQTLALADAVLKDDYQGPVRDQINNDCKITAQAIKNRRDFAGRRAIVPLKVSRNTGIGARLEGEVLPAAGNAGYVDQLVTVKSNYGKMRLTRHVIAAMKSDRGSFLRAIQSETDELKGTAARDYNRQSWGLGTGDIAAVKDNSTTGTNVITLAATTPEQTMWDLSEGMVIDVGTAAGVAPTNRASNRMITSVDIDAKTVTVSGAGFTQSSADAIYRQGSGGTGANQREITGIQANVGTGTLWGVNPSTYPSWKSLVDSNSGTLRALSENLVAKNMMRAQNRSGKRVNQLWCEGGVYRAAANLLQAQKRFVNAAQLEGGSMGLEFAVEGQSVPLMHDRDAPAGKLFGLCTDELTEYVLEDWQFDDLDGSTLRLATDGSQAYEAIWFKMSELATSRRNAHFIISDLITS